jgi:hypothetical protein
MNKHNKNITQDDINTYRRRECKYSESDNDILRMILISCDYPTYHEESGFRTSNSRDSENYSSSRSCGYSSSGDGSSSSSSSSCD